MNDTSTQSQGHLKTIGWVLSIIGGAMYMYGYFADGGAALVDWPLYLPEWAVQFIPNWQAEAGLVVSVIGAVPLYYVEIRNLRAA
mgnify:CR=1 FL=1